VITQPCPKFVELVEAGILTGEAVTEAILEYTTPMLEANAETTGDLETLKNIFPLLCPDLKDSATLSLLSNLTPS